MLVHWIWFAHRPGLNDRDKMALLQHFRDPEDIYFADDGAFDAIGLSEEAKTALREKNLTSAEEILEACDREKLHILTCQDAAYPARLKNIADPPVVLYYKGRLPDFDGSPVIGVVGTRKASAYGLTTAKRMGYQIARCGGIVVSGMAYGIDGMAMSGALTAGAPAVGVLGCGADIVYPKSWAPFAAMEQRTKLYAAGDQAGIDALEQKLLAQNAQFKNWTCSEEMMKRTKDGKALYLHCLPADITGVSCKEGEVDASVFDRYLVPLYKEASFKPYIIAAMILMSQVKDPVSCLRALDGANDSRKRF